MNNYIVGKEVITWYRADCLPANEDQKLVIAEKKDGRRSVNIAYYSFTTKSWHGSGSMSKVIAWAFLPEAGRVRVIKHE